MAWFKIKAGAHSYKDPATGANKVCRGPDSLGYTPGDEFFESDEDLAAKDPGRWQASRGPASARVAATAPKATATAKKK